MTINNSKLRKNIAGFYKRVLYYIFRIIPLKNKIIASAFFGNQYADNPKYVIEMLHKLNPTIDIVWVKIDKAQYQVPEYVRTVSASSRIKRIMEYATAKVWITSDVLFLGIPKRKGQLFIETWHGGLGIKKIEMDVEKFRDDNKLNHSNQETCRLADVFTSNSDHLSNIYRSAFGYTGAILKCGNARNDVLFSDNATIKEKIESFYSIPKGNKIAVYAPTFRESSNPDLYSSDDISMYEIEFDHLKKAIEDRFGDTWSIIVRMHPNQAEKDIRNIIKDYNVINATHYPDMQDIIMAADLFVSDYSSCIFDAAVRGIPCFTFATDIERYKADRGVYYEMEELPFPYARNNDELMNIVENFDADDYNAKWKAFAKKTGLHETGHAAKDIAEKIVQFMNGEKIVWE